MDIIEALSKNNLSIAVAESLTSGLVAANIANISGASNYFKGGIVAYTKEAKCKLLGLEMDNINKYGVYSFETAIAMALGVKKALDSDVSISTTGVAGPGDDENVKAGTVYFAIVIKDKIYTRNMVFNGSRNEVRNKATEYIILETIKLLND